MNITPDEIEKYLSLLSNTSRRIMRATQGLMMYACGTKLMKRHGL
jgi:hypothetical protein